jgi:hypothetical protein
MSRKKINEKKGPTLFELYWQDFDNPDNKIIEFPFAFIFDSGIIYGTISGDHYNNMKENYP